MLRERYFWLLIGLFILSALACNAFAGGGEPTLAVPPTPITITPGSDGSGGTLSPTLTPEAGATSTTNATATPSAPTATVLVDLNVRTGPGVQYDRVTFLLKDESAPILGKDPTGEWWKITCPPRTPVTGVQCWISGGSSFSTAVNTDGVTVAEVPPTPTPVPPEPQPGQAILAYVDNGRPLATTFDPNEESPNLTDLVPLVPDDANVQQVLISPDGRRLAYLRGTPDRTELHVVNLDGGDDRLLVDSGNLPLASDDAGLSAVVDKMQWLPDGSGLAFNTSQYSSSFGGAFGQEDLWTVTLDGTLTQRLPFYQGGGLFLVLPNGEILLSKRDAIEKVNADGSNRLRLITFDFINTASEYIYYPILQLARDGNTVFTAIPSPEPFGTDPSTHLWRIVGNGAEEMGVLPHNILFNPVQWSVNGTRLGYAAFPGSTPPGIILAEGNGNGAELYTTAEQLRFFGWSGDGQHFLFTSPNVVAVGQVDGDPVEIPIPAGGVVQMAEWLTNGRFLIVTVFEGGWRTDRGDTGGTIQELLVVPGSGDVEYDIWLP